MENEKIELTELSELGEFGLIDKLTKDIKIHNKSTIKGIGDDAAVIDHKSEQTLISTEHCFLCNFTFRKKYNWCCNIGCGWIFLFVEYRRIKGAGRTSGEGLVSCKSEEKKQVKSGR